MRFFVLALTCAGTVLGSDPAGLAARARELARDGLAAQALPLYREALRASPEDTEIRLDYATVLGWAERYEDSIREFEAALRGNERAPAWALGEMARSELFGGHPDRALLLLDRLIGDGDDSEVTVCRKGLALRWLGSSAEAEQAYRQALRDFPDSTRARLGVVYALGDRDRLEAALAEVEIALRRQPDNWEFLKARGQVLNWMGRHQAARRAFDAIPPVHESDREILEGRLAAARWGGDPATARELASRLPGSDTLRRDVLLDYGRAMTPSFRFASDSDGFSERLYEQDFSLHAGASDRIQLGVQQRQFSLDRELAWRRYDVSWSGNWSARWSGYGSVGAVAYSGPAADRRVVGDGAVAFAVNDFLRLSAGGGSMAMDAFQAVANRVTAPFFYLQADLQPSRSVSLETQYSQYRFTDGVRRDRLNATAFRRVYSSRILHLEAGASETSMWHDRPTGDFFSPASFHAVLGELRASGRFSRRVEYTAQFGAGAQRESGYALQSPMRAMASLYWRISPRLILRMDAARSTASLERMNAGRPAYSRAVAAISLAYRFE